MTLSYHADIRRRVSEEKVNQAIEKQEQNQGDSVESPAEIGKGPTR